MELKSIANIIDNYLCEELDLYKIQDEELEKIGDGYYFIDKNKIKYLICYTIFESITDLLSYWELYQNEFIASKLQMKTFSKNDIRWDIYYILLYNNEKYISPEIELSIERDSFCCKKVCINGFNKEELLEQLKDKLPISKNNYVTEDSNIISYKEFITRLCKNLGISQDKILIEEDSDFEVSELVIDKIVEAMGKKDDE